MDAERPGRAPQGARGTARSAPDDTRSTNQPQSPDRALRIGILLPTREQAINGAYAAAPSWTSPVRRSASASTPCGPATP